MEPTVLDAVGQPIAQGDVVAYVRVSSGRSFITRRRVASVEAPRTVVLVPLTPSSRSASALSYNMVRIEQGQNGMKK